MSWAPPSMARAAWGLCPEDLCPKRSQQRPATEFRQRHGSYVLLVTRESLRPALIQGKGNQVPLVDEGITRARCSCLWKVLSASVGDRDTCGNESWWGRGRSPSVGQGEDCCFEPDQMEIVMGQPLVLLASWQLEIVRNEQEWYSLGPGK